MPVLPVGLTIIIIVCIVRFIVWFDQWDRKNALMYSMTDEYKRGSPKIRLYKTGIIAEIDLYNHGKLTNTEFDQDNRRWIKATGLSVVDWAKVFNIKITRTV